MSEHTQGRMIIKEAENQDGIIFHLNRENDPYNTIKIVSESYARRFAAAWNACEGMTTEAIEALASIGSLGDLKSSELQAANERIAKLEALVAERDAMLGKRPCQNSRCNELNSVRAMLREVRESGIWSGINESSAKLADELEFCISSYLDACDTLEGK